MEKIPNPDHGDPEIIDEHLDGSDHIESRVKGVFRRINRFASKYPNLIKLIVVAEASLILVHVRKPESDEPLEIPAVQSRVEYHKPLDDSSGLIERLNQEVGSNVVWEITRTISVDSQEERHEVVNLPNPTKVERFEESVLTNEQVKDIVEKTIPQGFTRNFSSLVYINRERRVEPNRNALSVNLSGILWGRAFRNSRRIEIYKSASDNEGKTGLANNTIIHEAMHFQDWFSNKLLTVDEKLELLQKVIDRVVSPDRYKSEYIESIHDLYDRNELYHKAVEYFAEIGAIYFSPNYILLPEKDKELLRDFIKKTDPDFKRGDALRRRDEIVGYSVEDVLPLYLSDESREMRKKGNRERIEDSWLRTFERFTKKGMLEGLNQKQVEEIRDKYIQESVASYQAIDDDYDREREHIIKDLYNRRYKN